MTIAENIEKIKTDIPDALRNVKMFYGYDEASDVANEMILNHSSIVGGSTFALTSPRWLVKNKIDHVNIDGNYFENINKIAKEWDCEGYVKNIEKDNQCFFISDLPVEWIQKDDIPISFLYDVCKLPCKNKLFHEQYIEDIAKGFSIKTDILNRTLVLRCSPNDVDMQRAYLKENLYFDEIGFKNYKQCYSKNEFKKIVEENRPDILVIDSHGNFRENEDESLSFIYVCDEEMTGEDIKALSHYPKIVFISACNTRPLKQVEECIAEAFVERGCLAVTAAYVALNIDQGVSTIARFINNLKGASSSGVHSNWLSFIAHLERTFFAQTLSINIGLDAYDKEKSSLNTEIDELAKVEPEKKDLFENVKKKLESCDTKKEVLGCEQSLVGGSFYAREYYYKSWIERSKRTKGLEDPVKPEHLYYTNYGRMDLIPFDSAFPIRRNFEQEDWNNKILQSVARVQKMAELEDKLHLISKAVKSGIVQPKTKNVFRQMEPNKKIGRNDPCWCGSGIKFKKCHGRNS